MATYLDKILAAHRAAAAKDRRDLDALVAEAQAAPPARGFADALAANAHASAKGRLAVIAEVKRKSPSKGDLAADLDPVTLAGRYEAGGAAALSVLTDKEFFSGSPDDLRMARAAVGIPVLRKDFTVAPADVADARIMGADALLLIVAALEETELADLLALAGTLGLDALVEVHDEAEAELALSVGARVVGVNQRDLVTFEVDTARAERVVKVLPETVVRVAESGIRNAADAGRLADAGYDAVLVGEALVTAGDPAAAVGAMSRSSRAR